MSIPTGVDDEGQSFADVLNNLSGGPWRWPLSPRTALEQPTRLSARPGPVELPAARSPTGFQPVGLDEWSEPVVAASVVRPYTWTGGRTAPVLDLAVETLVSTSERGHDRAALTSEEHRAVAELCRSPRSVAEVAALLSVPLGVARVLLADMADLSLVVVHRSANSSGGTPELALMERVLSGLRRL